MSVSWKGEDLSGLENLKNCNMIEVKIKQGNEMLDATIEMVDGVMVVSPKEVKFEPKDGDALSCFFNGEYQGTFIFEEESECGEAIFHFALDADGKFIKGNGCNYFAYVYNARLATEEEKKKLFDKLKEEGYEWDAEKKEVVKIKWKPVLCKVYYRPQFYQGYFEICKDVWNDSTSDEIFYNKGWCFKTKEESQKFCDKLNQAIEGVKP